MRGIGFECRQTRLKLIQPLPRFAKETKALAVQHALRFFHYLWLSPHFCGHTHHRISEASPHSIRLLLNNRLASLRLRLLTYSKERHRCGNWEQFKRVMLRTPNRRGTVDSLLVISGEPIHNQIFSILAFCNQTLS